jgi:hypothetical protein
MTYIAQEESVEDGQPIELFRFSNVEETFLFTNGQNEVVFNSETYVPTAVLRSDPDLQNVTAQRTLTITLPITNAFVERYVTQVPATIDEFQLFRQHTTDGGTPETITYFTGQVTNVSFKGAQAEVSIQNFGAVLDRLVPQQTSRNPCNHILYDGKCGVTDTNFAITGVVSAISADGLTVTIDTGTNTIIDTGLQLSAQLTADSTFFNGGLVARASIELRMSRVVTDSTGNVATILVLFPFQTLSVGQAIQLFAGCDHQLPTCDTKFSNSDRYGGFPFIPLKNPFAIGVN